MSTTHAFESLALVLFVASGCGDDTTKPAGGTATVTTGMTTGAVENTTGSAGDSTTSAQTGEPSTGGGGSTDTTAGPADTSSSGAAESETGGSTSGAAGPTWNNFGADFFDAYCSECHGAGDPQGRDYSTLAGVLPELAPIRCGTGPASAPPSDCDAGPPPEQFPIGMNTPTEAERILLVEWIDAGAPEG